MIGVSLALAFWQAATAGPGLGKVTCTAPEHLQPIAFFDESNGVPAHYGTNQAVLANGYLMLLWAPDGGKGPGGLLFYDVSNPRAPVLVHSVADANTELFRESHSIPVARVEGRLYAVVQTVVGIQFWDVTEATDARMVSRLDLPGVEGGDYDNVAWQTSWQWPYVFVGGANHGVFVVDASNIEQPTLATRLPASRSGGFPVGPVFALGDQLVIVAMAGNGAYGLVDIADPTQPFLITVADGFPRLYSSGVYGHRIYGAGREGELLILEFGDQDIVELSREIVGGDGLYVTAQDRFVHLGQAEAYRKVDVALPQTPQVVGTAVLGRPNADHGQTMPFGNLVFIGNDHGTGSAFVCHAIDPDADPPTVEALFPPDGGEITSRSRITVSFSDNIDFDSVDGASFTVRPVGGSAIDGGFSSIFNAVSFGPRLPLAPGEYEIVLAAGGIRDVSGNALTEAVVSGFRVRAPSPGGGDRGCGCGSAVGMEALALAPLILGRRRRKP
jgi:hypothetical protein